MLATMEVTQMSNNVLILDAGCQTSVKAASSTIIYLVSPREN